MLSLEPEIVFNSLFTLQIRQDCAPLLEKAMAPHSSTLAWKIPWTEEPGGLWSIGSLRVGHDWATSLSVFTFMHWRRKWQPTPVFLPGESQGRGEPGGLPSLGSHRVGHNWGDLAAAAAGPHFSRSSQSDHHSIPSKIWGKLEPKWNLNQVPLPSLINLSIKNLIPFLAVDLSPLRIGEYQRKVGLKLCSTLWSSHPHNVLAPTFGKILAKR